MKPSFVLVLLVLIAVGLGAWVATERKEKAALALELDAARQELAVLRTDTSTKSKTTAMEGTGVESLPVDSEVMPKQPASDLPKKPDNPMAAMAKMMEDPAMRDVMKAQMHTQVDFVYRDFFDLLDLDEAGRDALTELLVERTGAGMELGLAMMSGAKLSKEEKQQRGEEMNEVIKASDASLKELLGEEDFGKFERYERSQPERQQLNVFSAQLRGKDIAMSGETEAQLMDAMYEERTNFKYDVDFADQKSFDPAKFNRTNLERFAQQQTVVRERILARASSLLTPEQLEIFRSSQEQQAAMEKMGMEMGLNMISGDE